MNPMARTAILKRFHTRPAVPQADLTGQCVFEGGDQE